MQAYYPNQPVDKGGNLMPNSPAPIKAKATYYTVAGATVSSVITLTDNTTLVEIAASGTGALVRWVPTTETSSVSPFASVTATNFDHVVPANTVRRFAVPIEGQGVNSVVGVGVQGGYFRRVAVAPAGILSSILTTEF